MSRSQPWSRRTELITLVDEQDETLFEILLTIDGKKNLSNYVLLVPVNAEEDENGEVEIKHSFIKEDGTEGEYKNQSQKTQKTNGTWLKKSSTAFGGVIQSGRLYHPNS